MRCHGWWWRCQIYSDDDVLHVHISVVPLRVCINGLSLRLTNGDLPRCVRCTAPCKKSSEQDIRSISATHFQSFFTRWSAFLRSQFLAFVHRRFEFRYRSSKRLALLSSTLLPFTTLSLISLTYRYSWLHVVVFVTQKSPLKRLHASYHTQQTHTRVWWFRIKSSWSWCEDA